MCRSSTGEGVWRVLGTAASMTEIANGVCMLHDPMPLEQLNPGTDVISKDCMLHDPMSLKPLHLGTDLVQTLDQEVH